MSTDQAHQTGSPQHDAARVPTPIRVVVKGCSLPSWMSPMGGPRTDFTYPRALEDELRQRGHESEVRNHATIAAYVTEGLRTWRREIVHFSPDVVVLHYGMLESAYLFLPRGLEQHAHSMVTVKRPVRFFYRKRILWPLWRFLALAQQAIDKRVHKMPFTYRHRRVARDMAELIKRISQIGNPLILVPLTSPPGHKYHAWFPGFTHRAELLNAELERMVAAIDSPNVRIFRTGDALESATSSGDLRDAVPDGAHYTPEGHRAIGRAMADEILDWAGDQPHLAPTGRTSEGA